MFSFGIVVDLEATCYDQKEKPPPGWQPEIIEFPAVLVDLKSGKIIEEFHHFVQPTQTTEISQFCRKFLHLGDRNFEDNQPLRVVIEKFCAWEPVIK